MWIYSLGITLRRAVHTLSTGTNQQATAGTTVEAYYNDAAPTTTTTATSSSTTAITSSVKNPSNNRNPTSLERVIRAMCAPNIYYRASLMYLLDVSNIAATAAASATIQTFVEFTDC